MAKGYGWELEKVKELSEVEAYEALYNLDKIQKQEKASRLSEQSVAVSAGMGDKKAHQRIKKTIDEISQEQKLDQKKEILRTGQGKLSIDKLLTAEDFSKILEQVDKNGGLKNSRDIPKV